MLLTGDKTLKQRRAGELGHHPFRTERFYHANNAWYFLIRGGTSKGPYHDRSEAEGALQHYVETQRRLNQVFHDKQRNLQH